MGELSFAVDPESLRTAAANLAGFADHADQLHQRAVAGQDLSAADFPRAEWGQRAGKVWDDARPVFADGLRLVRQMLAQHSADTTTASTDYQATDSAAASTIERSGT